jgi:hypothetical protein
LAEGFAVNADFLPLRIDTRAQFGDDLPVDLDSPFENELFALAPAGNAGRCEDLLQSLADDIWRSVMVISMPARR